MATSELSTLPLLSWIDVARRLSTIPMRHEGVAAPLAPPAGLIASDVFWTGLILTLESPAQIPVVQAWLQDVFGSWVHIDTSNNSFIKLEGPSALGNLRVIYEFNGPDAKVPVFRPNASLEGHRSYSVSFPERLDDSPSVVAFHSVKGGVGRTTAAMAFAKNMSENSGGSPVLFIDADFEAPGISYLYRTRKPDVSVSLEDMLALAHADTSGDLSSTVSFVAAQMLDQRIDDIYVLPVKRLLNDLSGFTIRPEHLVNARKNQPYLIVDLVRALAKALGCRIAVVDLRAGLVDIALHFLTDPSVERVFVSTASGQSINALKGMLQTIGHIERQTGISGRQPFVLFNQVPRHQFEDADFRSTLQSQLETQAESAFLLSDGLVLDADSSVTPGLESTLAFGFHYHVPDLIASVDEWVAYFQELHRTGFTAGLKSEMENWMLTRRLGTLPASHPQTLLDPVNHSDACTLLAEFAEKLEFAETVVDVQRPLITPPLQRLIGDFVQHAPITVIEGTKGTGKTLTFRYLLEHESWAAASKTLESGQATSFEGVFLPVFGSVNSSESMQKLVADGRVRVAKRLSTNPPSRFSETTDGVKHGIKEKWDVPQWTIFWLDSIARAAGFTGTANNWESFLNAVKNAGVTRPIAMFEGLEEEFVNPYTDVVHADALRSLFRDVPIKLREEAGRPIGLIVFARSDMVEAVIEQNVQQFRASYRNYALTWRDLDIQELVIWLVSNSGAIPGIWTPNWRARSEIEREGDLRRVWGLKLGSDSGKEARSTEWVVAVLTDLTGRLTARDLVRFIHQAALSSKSQAVEGRLLTANAMRKAVEYTSYKKVDEYPKEVRELLPIFGKLKSISDLATPFDRIEAASKGIESQELDILEKYGVAYADEGSFEVPELFRIGLNMKRKGARPNIISLTRKARERAKA
jgi:MinD-like ATPase involved in chromosome partitioning or flagellar assembly